MCLSLGRKERTRKIKASKRCFFPGIYSDNIKFRNSGIEKGESSTQSGFLKMGDGQNLKKQR